MSREPWVAGIDIGGTTLKAALVDYGGEVRALESTSSNVENLPSFKRSFGGLLAKLGKKVLPGARLAAAGIGCKGVVDTGTSRIRILPGQFAFLEGLRLDRLISDALGFSLPVSADNDAKTALVGEQRWGAARGKQHVVLLTLGSGVGGAFLSAGAMVRGCSEIAGHLGHVTVDFQGPLCSCGNRGCLEAVFSARAIEGDAVASIRRGCESPLRAKFAANPESLTCLDVFTAAASGDPMARGIVERAVAALAAAMAGMAHALDPELFILGGQIAEAGPTLFGPLRKDFYGRTLRLVGRRIPIRKAALGESAGVLGAAASAWKVLESDSLRFLAPSRLRGERSVRRIHR